MRDANIKMYSFDETHCSMLSLLIDKRSALLNAAAKITGCRSRAEDVVQDAYLRLNTIALNELPLKAKVSYIYNVVRNLAIDHYRKQELEQKYFDTEEAGLNVDTGNATPDHIYHNRKLISALDQALSELPKRTRYAFEMHRVHGKQQKEIATELGVSTTLVNFMVRDALIHCKKFMDSQRDADNQLGKS